MKYSGTLIAVSDMEKSKNFYNDVLGLKVIDDFGANVVLEGGFFLQSADSWENFIRTKDITLKNNSFELYFEEKDMDFFLNHLAQCSVTYVHEPLEHSWGQKAVRFRDPDGHIIEVAEEISAVVRRFLTNGLTEEETAIRMDVPLEYIKSCLE